MTPPTVSREAEAFCHTVSQCIPAEHIYRAGALGVVVFGGAAWAIGFFPSSVFAVAFGVAASVIFGLLFLPLLVILHEAAHFAAFRIFGAKARFMWVMHNGKPVAPSVCGPDKWLWRWQYAFVILAPTVVVSAAGVALMAMVPVLRGPLVVALTLHLMGCVNDWYVFGAAVALPRGTRIEDREGGFAHRVAVIGRVH